MLCTKQILKNTCWNYWQMAIPPLYLLCQIQLGSLAECTLLTLLNRNTNLEIVPLAQLEYQQVSMLCLSSERQQLGIFSLSKANISIYKSGSGCSQKNAPQNSFRYQALLICLWLFHLHKTFQELLCCLKQDISILMSPVNQSV